MKTCLITCNLVAFIKQNTSSGRSRPWGFPHISAARLGRRQLYLRPTAESPLRAPCAPWPLGTLLHSCERERNSQEVLWSCYGIHLTPRPSEGPRDHPVGGAMLTLVCGVRLFSGSSGGGLFPHLLGLLRVRGQLLSCGPRVQGHRAAGGENPCP